MSETSKTEEWSDGLLLNELIEKGGLNEDDIKLSSPDRGLFLYKEKIFFKYGNKKSFIVVTETDDRNFKKILDIFSVIVGYQPFCKYTEPTAKRIVTYEWDRDPKSRYQELVKEGAKDLTLLIDPG